MGQCRMPSDGADSRARQGLGRSSDRPFFIMIPEFLSHLKTHQGLPVPFMQAVFDGMPDFRVVDPKKVIQCAEEKVCAICGQRLGEKCYFICGERSKASHLFTDPPMHNECAVFAAETCPFLGGRKLEYSDRPMRNAAKVHEMVSTVRPAQMFILTAYTKKTRLVMHGDSVSIQAENWIGERIVDLQMDRQ